MALILCHGGMFSGKSNLAIGRIDAHNNQKISGKENLPAILYQPKKNIRDVFQGEPVWFTRAGGNTKLLLQANWFESTERVLKEKNSYGAFGFEEWQMYPEEELFYLMKELHHSGKLVVAAGLDYYFNGEPVGIFDRLRKLEGAILLPGPDARCLECYNEGRGEVNAVRTQRVCNSIIESFDAPKIIVDGNKDYKYLPVCFDHWRVDPPKDASALVAYKKWYTNKKKDH